MFKENLPKEEPLSRELWAQKPTHMGGTYPYPQHVMLPPPPGPRSSHFDSFCLKVNSDSPLSVQQSRRSWESNHQPSEWYSSVLP